MKINKIKYFTYVLFIASAVQFGCGKTTAGPKGETGPAGNDGNATVKTINSFLVPSLSWEPTDTTEREWKTIIFSDQITDDIINKGAVHVYVQRGQTWWALPFTEGTNTTLYGLESGKVSLKNFNADSHRDEVPRPAAQNFRLVILTQQ